MSRIAVLAFAAALSVVGPAVAQQPTAPAAVAKPVPPNAAEFDKELSRLQDHFKQMQSYMDRMQTTQDPQERQRLIQQHWEAMQSGMNLMHGMWGPGQGYGCCGGPGGMGPGRMMGPMMGWGHMQGYYSGLTPDQLRQRQYMMDQYVPMQNMMMNHMMWHQQWQRAPAPAK